MEAPPLRIFLQAKYPPAVGLIAARAARNKVLAIVASMEARRAGQAEAIEHVSIKVLDEKTAVRLRVEIASSTLADVDAVRVAAISLGKAVGGELVTLALGTASLLSGAPSVEKQLADAKARIAELEAKAKP